MSGCSNGKMQVSKTLRWRFDSSPIRHIMRISEQVSYKVHTLESRSITEIRYHILATLRIVCYNTVMVWCHTSLASSDFK